MPTMGSSERRRCVQCGVPLSRSNAGTRCASCQREPVRRLDPAFWATPAVRDAAAAWEIGIVVRLFRQHTGLSQAAVARLVNIDQAEVSRLERGRKKIRDRRRLAQWGEALGMPDDLMGPLPSTEHPPPHSVDRADSRLEFPDGPGHLLLPAGRSLPPTALPTLTGPASTFRGSSLWLSPSRDIKAWTCMPLRALIVASRVVDGAQRYFAVDAREGAARSCSQGTGPRSPPGCALKPSLRPR
ncbi:helix-turn-helix domain-containing protein [Streptomyces sp. A3M-1-3]|uniref:helix-turn-helix domain-containing protein n=1 Tax=Streptomyces sp. A3M-1-3 TaxID=2962044 RepID=UPI0035ABC661